MEYYITTSADYWIAPNAVYITLNALGEANRIQGSVATGAVIMCFIEDIKAESAGGEAGNGDGLWYGANHEPKRWPLSLSPTYFNSDTRKYVYVAVPRRAATGSQAVIVFPSELLDIYGRAERTAPADSVSGNDGQEPAVTTYEQVGSEDYFYIYLHGIIGAPAQSGGVLQRQWEEDITDWGRLDTAQGRDEKQASADWYTYANNVVTFLKDVIMKEGSNFRNILLNHKNLTDVATSAAAAPVNSDTAVATPNYVEKFYLSKTHADAAQGVITFLAGLTSEAEATFGNYLRDNGMSEEQITETGARIFPNGLGDFVNLIVKGAVQGYLNVEGDINALSDIVFHGILRSAGASPLYENGNGIWLDASTGTGSFDGLEVRGFMKVMELVINRLQLMESDYSFTEGGTTEHIVNNADGTLTITIHKSHDNDIHPFAVGDVLYGKVNDLLSHGTYYTTWMRVNAIDQEENTITVALYGGDDVPGGRNFTPYGTGFTDASLKGWLSVEPEEYDKPVNLTRRGNTTNTARQDSWHLSTTDRHFAFLRGVTGPKIGAENWGLILGYLPNVTNADGTPFFPTSVVHPGESYSRIPYLYAGGLVIDHEHIHHMHYPEPTELTIEDCGEWSANKTYYRGIRTLENGVKEGIVQQVLYDGKTWLVAKDYNGGYVGVTSTPSDNNTDWVCTGGGKDGENALQVIILGPNIIKNGVGSVRLTAYAYDGMEDVSNTLQTAAWSWERTSLEGDNTDSDNAWNLVHKGYGRTLEVNQSEILVRAWFECIVDFNVVNQIVNS